jgi:hypothetical protein
VFPVLVVLACDPVTETLDMTDEPGLAKSSSVTWLPTTKLLSVNGMAMIAVSVLPPPTHDIVVPVDPGFTAVLLAQKHNVPAPSVVTAKPFVAAGAEIPANPMSAKAK